MSVINTNITSMIGQSNLQKSQSALQTSMERLSSGLRINSAKDDAAGQAIANRMTAQITGLAQAQRNANDGISIAQTAEGGLNQVNDNLQRIRELTVQAQNGTNSESDLNSIQDEINQRLGEINRISEETDFNGTRVLSDSAETLKIQVGSEDGQTIEVNLKNIDSESLGLKNFSVSQTQIELSDTVARLSDIDPTQTNIDASDNASFELTGGGGEFATAIADGTTAGGGDLETYLAAGSNNVTFTGDLTGAGNDQAVYSVEIDGGQYFATSDGNGIQLLKSDGANGYTAVTADYTDNAGNAVTGGAVEMAVVEGRLTAYVQDADDNNARSVDLSGGLNNVTVGENLAAGDSNISVNIDGENYEAREIVDEDGNGTGQFGARLDDGTVVAVSVNASGIGQVIEDDQGNAAQYVLNKDGSADAVIDIDGTLFNADDTATTGTAAVNLGTEYDTEQLQTTGTANPLDTLDKALNQVDELRSELGAVQNRFESAIENLSTNETNLSAARSRIEDADYATEVADMTRAQILQQAGTSVLAQANQIPQNVLSLLG